MVVLYCVLIKLIYKKKHSFRLNMPEIYKEYTRKISSFFRIRQLLFRTYQLFFNSLCELWVTFYILYLNYVLLNDYFVRTWHIIACAQNQIIHILYDYVQCRPTIFYISKFIVFSFNQNYCFYLGINKNTTDKCETIVGAKFHSTIMKQISQSLFRAATYSTLLGPLGTDNLPIAFLVRCAVQTLSPRCVSLTIT